VRVALILIGILLACVGIFPVDRFFLLHNTVATGMAVCFAAVDRAAVVPAPDLARVRRARLGVRAGDRAARRVLRDRLHNLTAVELIAAVLIFSWIIVFLRTAGADHGPWDAERVVRGGASARTERRAPVSRRSAVVHGGEPLDLCSASSTVRRMIDDMASSTSNSRGSRTEQRGALAADLAVGGRRVAGGLELALVLELSRSRRRTRSIRHRRRRPRCRRYADSEVGSSVRNGEASPCRCRPAGRDRNRGGRSQGGWILRAMSLSGALGAYPLQRARRQWEHRPSSAPRRRDR
jgi:hypothetical protein